MISPRRRGDAEKGEGLKNSTAKDAKSAKELENRKFDDPRVDDAHNGGT